MKWKALLISIILAALAVGSVNQVPLWLFGLPSVGFFCLWAYKFIRDLSVVVQARRPEDTSQTPAISMTSKGSRRLFVPPSIDK